VEGPREEAADASGSTGSAWLDRAVGAMVRWNDGAVRRADGHRSARYDVEGETWYRELRARHAAIRAEWDDFVASGRSLPLIDDLLGGYQGHDGDWWRAAPLVARARPVPGVADRFPVATQALLAVPGLMSAMWSVMAPRTGLPEHEGTNAGALRLLFSVDGGPDAVLGLEGDEIAFVDGQGIVFDDTAPHWSWNAGTRPRVLLLCDILRPLPAPQRWANVVVQHAHHLAIPRYRRIAKRAGGLIADGDPAGQAGPAPR
jgi:beta-hydroxylase